MKSSEHKGAFICEGALGIGSLNPPTTEHIRIEDNSNIVSMWIDAFGDFRMTDASVNAVSLGELNTHNDSDGLQGGIIGEYYHLTQSQYDAFGDLPDHNNTLNIQGGSVTERYHLTSAQYTIATQAASGSQYGYVTNTTQTFGAAKTFDSLLTAEAGLALSNQGEIRFYELATNGTNYINLLAPSSLSSNYTLILPTSDGNSGQALTTDSGGNLYWKNNFFLEHSSDHPRIGYNCIYDEGQTRWEYVADGVASKHKQDGSHTFSVAVAGTAGNEITWIDAVHIEEITGNVGFGISDPTTLVDIRKDASDAKMRILAHSATGSHAGIVEIGSSRGSISSPSGTIDKDTLGTVSFVGNTGLGASYLNGATITSIADGNWTAVIPGNRGTYLSFRTTENDTSTLSEKVRITGEGCLEITPTTTDALKIHKYGSAVGQTGELQFMEGGITSTNYVGFKAPGNISTDTIWELPAADGASGQCLSTDGSGALAWEYVDEMEVRMVTANATLSLTDKVIMCLPTGNITITLPRANTVPNDGYMREYYVKNASSFQITIITQSPDAFLPGNDKIVLHTINDTAHIGVMYSSDGTYSWASIANQEVVCQVRNTASWPSTEFASLTAFPFNTVDILDNDSVIEWNIAASTRIISKISGKIKLSYWFAVDSTGGSTYIVEAYVRKNGTDAIDGTWIRTGNYQNEDQSGGIGVIIINVQEDDYFELMFDHDSLTGNLIGTTLIASMQA